MDNHQVLVCPLTNLAGPHSHEQVHSAISSHEWQLMTWEQGHSTNIRRGHDTTWKRKEKKKSKLKIKRLTRLDVLKISHNQATWAVMQRHYWPFQSGVWYMTMGWGHWERISNSFIIFMEWFCVWRVSQTNGEWLLAISL